MTELPWISKARSYIGLKEDASKTKHNPQLVYMMDIMGRFNGEARAWWRDDETPWCGLFAGFVLGQTGRHVVKQWYRAREWESDTMTKLDRPAYGCIVTFTRSGGGHVGFVVGKDRKGNIMVLGGNQGNAVNIKPFSVDRVTGFYWPSSFEGAKLKMLRPIPSRYDLPVIESNGRLSKDES